MRHCIRLFAALCACLLFGSACFAQIRVLVDQVGYETHASKVGLIEGTEGGGLSGFALIDDDSGRTVFTGTLQAEGTVDRWGHWSFWKADFSSWTTPGHYRLTAATANGTVS